MFERARGLLNLATKKLDNVAIITKFDFACHNLYEILHFN